MNYNHKYDNFLTMYLTHFKEYGTKSPIFEQFNKPFIVKLFFMFRHFIAFLLKDLSNQSNETLKNKLVYYAISKNTLNALSFLNQEPNTLLIYTSLKLKTPEVNKKAITSKWKYSTLYFQVLVYFFKTNKPFAIAYFDLIYYSIGYYETFIKILSIEKPQVVVFSNDHNYDSRALLMACKELDIKTIYIQHASVTKLFPPLSFDLNLLEGEDSLEKYRECGEIEGKTRLIGMPRFDNYMHHLRSKKRNIESIGVAFNMIDNLDSLHKLLVYLIENTNYKITYRPHPREARDLSVLNHLTALKKSSSEENAFDFLKNQDVLIAGSSSILLEACLLNVIPIYYRFESDFDDVYSFVKKGLAHPLDKITDLQMVINNYSEQINVRSRAKYYNATVDTNDDGKSSILALQFIKQFIEE